MILLSIRGPVLEELVLLARRLGVDPKLVTDGKLVEFVAAVRAAEKRRQS